MQMQESQGATYQADVRDNISLAATEDQEVLNTNQTAPQRNEDHIRQIVHQKAFKSKGFTISIVLLYVLLLFTSLIWFVLTLKGYMMYSAMTEELQHLRMMHSMWKENVSDGMRILKAAQDILRIQNNNITSEITQLKKQGNNITSGISQLKKQDTYISTSIRNLTFEIFQLKQQGANNSDSGLLRIQGGPLISDGD
ncbi:uncharacterized protein [Lepisosteus oculatus]|uniref:uncharacterized protein isoform X2 n=1 Tax=Lepisosteus oculatus TaxID=7918 RepID=UPI0035F52AB5